VFCAWTWKAAPTPTAFLRYCTACAPNADNVGVVVQAYLLRSRADVLGLIDAGIPVRLCKGAAEPVASRHFH
jgi:hypothetical protein